MRIPNGVVTSDQLFFIAEAMAKYGEDYEAVVDITTRQNLQLRGLKVGRTGREKEWRWAAEQGGGKGKGGKGGGEEDLRFMRQRSPSLDSIFGKS